MIFRDNVVTLHPAEIRALLTFTLAREVSPKTWGYGRKRAMIGVAFLLEAKRVEATDGFTALSLVDQAGDAHVNNLPSRTSIVNRKTMREIVDNCPEGSTVQFEFDPDRPGWFSASYKGGGAGRFATMPETYVWPHVPHALRLRSYAKQGTACTLGLDARYLARLSAVQRAAGSQGLTIFTTAPLAPLQFEVEGLDGTTYRGGIAARTSNVGK